MVMLLMHRPCLRTGRSISSILMILVMKVCPCPSPRAHNVSNCLFVAASNILVSGIIHSSRPIFGTQFHPEARGGPLDSAYLFDSYLDTVKAYKKSQAIFQPKRESRPSPMLVDILAKERVGVAPTIGMQNMRREPALVAAAAAA
jgi:carbamoyl-phosphate synthase small subunit